MVTIILAEDHSIVREGLKALLEREPDFKVVGEASNGLTTIRICEKLKPDVLVSDIMMDDITGIEVTRQLKELLPKINIIVLSMYSDEKHVLEALQAGAKGYVVKTSVTSELVQAIREVISGHRYLGPSLTDLVVDAYLEERSSAIPDPYDSLSSREREVLHLAAHGYTNVQIAQQLLISRRTVETHRANAMRKLNLTNQIELLRYGIQKGILPP